MANPLDPVTMGMSPCCRSSFARSSVRRWTRKRESGATSASGYSVFSSGPTDVGGQGWAGRRDWTELEGPDYIQRSRRVRACVSFQDGRPLRRVQRARWRSHPHPDRTFAIRSQDRGFLSMSSPPSAVSAGDAPSSLSIPRPLRPSFCGRIAGPSYWGYLGSSFSRCCSCQFRSSRAGWSTGWSVISGRSRPPAHLKRSVHRDKPSRRGQGRPDLLVRPRIQLPGRFSSC